MNNNVRNITFIDLLSLDSIYRLLDTIKKKNSVFVVSPIFSNLLVVVLLTIFMLSRFITFCFLWLLYLYLFFSFVDIYVTYVV